MCGGGDDRFAYTQAVDVEQNERYISFGQGAVWRTTKRSKPPRLWRISVGPKREISVTAKALDERFEL